VTDAAQTSPAFPGGTAVTHLTVYDWPGPDGLVGGSAHVHLACTEGYVVLSGTGRVQTLSTDGFAETPLTPMTVAWFSPGVVHRLVNDGGLQILAVMQNGGLPEAGDSVLTFPPAYLSGPQAYEAVASLGGQGAEGSAQRRQYLAVEGFLLLREQAERRGPAALEEFYAAAVALIRGRVQAWDPIWRQGPLAAAVRTGEHLEALAAGRHEHLGEGRLTVLTPPERRSYGMCGRLAAYPAIPR
jgi:mannose-6-phosphate isomerase-like protein (cupin superfamily)